MPQIQPAPGGVRREYWVQAETVRWAITPKQKDEWHNRSVGGRNSFTAYVYRPMTPGFADYLIGHPTIPGPALQAEVGDVLVVHFRNADRRLDQAVTMHPHGVKYNPEYDGAYLGEFTRAGGFVAPGQTFTYQWECTPDSVGHLAVSRPRPQPHAEHVPRPVRRGDRAPEGREAARSRATRCSPTSCRRRSPGSIARSTASTAAPTPATRRR